MQGEKLEVRILPGRQKNNMDIYKYIITLMLSIILGFIIGIGSDIKEIKRKIK